MKLVNPIAWEGRSSDPQVWSGSLLFATSKRGGCRVSSLARRTLARAAAPPMDRGSGFFSRQPTLQCFNAQCVHIAYMHV